MQFLFSFRCSVFRLPQLPSLLAVLHLCLTVPGVARCCLSVFVTIFVDSSTCHLQYSRHTQTTQTGIRMLRADDAALHSIGRHSRLALPATRLPLAISGLPCQSGRIWQLFGSSVPISTLFVSQSLPNPPTLCISPIV